MTDLRSCVCGRRVELRCQTEHGTATFHAYGATNDQAVAECRKCGRDLAALLAIGLLKPVVNDDAARKRGGTT